jgi:hypothetical protein
MFTSVAFSLLAVLLVFGIVADSLWVHLRR